MTRDEAKATVSHIQGCHPVKSAEIVDTLVALGVLKLDEPKTIEQRTTEIIERHATAAQSMHIVAGLKKAGLL